MNTENNAITTNPEINLVVSFRGEKICISLLPGASVLQVKTKLASTVDPTLHMTPTDIKLLHKGKVLSNDVTNLHTTIISPQKNKNKKPTTTVRLIATGLSQTEATNRDTAFRTGLRTAPRVRDDLTASGRRDTAVRQKLGRRTLRDAASRDGRRHGGGGAASSPTTYGFGKIETLPDLPERHRARAVLDELANDPGVLACMAKHRWNVGCLSELYPEGNVGVTDVCVMGLNRNGGQEILLRLRTDDLKGWRKMLSVRKVLYHELAHNVHSEHNDEFFKLMRQIERECNEMDWTKRGGNSVGGVGRLYNGEDGCEDDANHLYEGGSWKLGGDNTTTIRTMPVRELTARAAMMRLSAEDEEIQRYCGCGRSGHATHTDGLFLPGPGIKIEDKEDNSESDDIERA